MEASTDTPRRHRGRSLARAALLVVALAHLGCGAGRQQTPDETQAEALERLFAAVRDGDCEAARAAVAGDLARRFADKGCDAALHELRELDMQLEEVVESKLDGRPGHGYIVTVVLSMGAGERRREKTTRVRLEAKNGSWVVVNI